MHVDGQFSVSLHATLKSEQSIIRSFTMNMTVNLIDLISYNVSKLLQYVDIGTINLITIANVCTHVILLLHNPHISLPG